MQAMILAAGKGTRMLPLTAKTPKPLVLFKNKPLIEHLIINLKKAGINSLVINLHHLGEQIKNTLGTGKQFGVQIQYSEEPTLLDTGGGVLKAINNNLLTNDPFIVVSGDIITDFDFSSLTKKLTKLAHLVLAPNPPYHKHGDFSLKDHYLQLPHYDHNLNFNYAGIGIYDPKFFSDLPRTAFPLVYLFNKAIKHQQITAEVYNGWWHNIGTLEELDKLNQNE